MGPGWWQASDAKWYPPAGPAAPGPVVSSPNYNPLSIVSLVLAVSFCGIGAIPAIICGFVAKRQIREAGGAQTGEALATAGIIFGFVSFVGLIVYVLLQIVVYSST